MNISNAAMRQAGQAVVTLRAAHLMPGRQYTAGLIAKWDDLWTRPGVPAAEIMAGILDLAERDAVIRAAIDAPSGRRLLRMTYADLQRQVADARRIARANAQYQPDMIDPDLFAVALMEAE